MSDTTRIPDPAETRDHAAADRSNTPHAKLAARTDAIARADFARAVALFGDGHICAIRVEPAPSAKNPGATKKAPVDKAEYREEPGPDGEPRRVKVKVEPQARIERMVRLCRELVGSGRDLSAYFPMVFVGDVRLPGGERFGVVDVDAGGAVGVGYLRRRLGEPFGSWPTLRAGGRHFGFLFADGDAPDPGDANGWRYDDDVDGGWARKIGGDLRAGLLYPLILWPESFERLESPDGIAGTPPTPVPAKAWTELATWEPEPSSKKKYGSASFTLETLAAEVKEAGEGERNDRLNAKSFKAGQWGDAMGWSETDARRVLVAAAVEAGLGQEEAETTFASGWANGAAEPKERTAAGRKRDPEKEHLSELEVAIGFSRTLEGEDWHHVRETGVWVEWTDKSGWSAPSRAVRHEVSVYAQAHLVREVNGQIKPDTKGGGSGRVANAALGHFADLPGVSTGTGDWDRIDAEALGCTLNGTAAVVDLSAAKAGRHPVRRMRRDDLLLHRLGAAPVSEREDPEAHARVNGFLEAHVPDDDEREFVLDFLTLTLIGSKVDQMLVLRGPTATGKTTLIKLVEAALGDFAATVAVEIVFREGSRTATGWAVADTWANLHGSRLAVINDPAEDARFDPSGFKNLTAGARLRARVGNTTFETSCTWNALMSCNVLPSGIPEQYVRRLAVISMTEQPRKLVESFKTTFPRDCGGALTAILLARVPALAARGFELELPATCTAAREDLAKAPDRFERFVDATMVRDPKGTIRRADVPAAYARWAQASARGDRDEAIGERGLIARFQKLGVRPSKRAHNGVRDVNVFVGVRWREGKAPPSEDPEGSF